MAAVQPRKFDARSGCTANTARRADALATVLGPRADLAHGARSIIGKTDRRAFDPPNQMLDLLMPGLFSDLPHVGHGYYDRRHSCGRIHLEPDSVPGRGVAFDGPVALARSELISFSAQLAG